MMMDRNHSAFLIPRHLDKGNRLMGLPRDEILPALGIGILLFLAKHQFVGFLLAICWFAGLRYLKIQHGPHIIALSFYWWGSASIARRIFKRTPPAEYRYWLY
ncbi:type IV conjugative transfer system protein TraL [Vibrio nigripulchritudo]|uniref:type IV conjugative transfer system protein TraL n=1 Tax=Vibrio nigripulchritudo TaxID=28173 RepID=UPI000B1EB050|nr:type IV conjugative transfer system protein TraL [Vibrio nigripulchritudo]